MNYGIAKVVSYLGLGTSIQFEGIHAIFIGWEQPMTSQFHRN